MNLFKTTLSLSCMLTITTSLWAQSPTPQSHTPPPYGDNPNIFKVLAYKTQQKVQTTAEKIGAETEKGIAKIKPKVDQAWENTKTYSAEQAAIAKENTQKAVQTATQKWQETQNAVIGQPNEAPVPIEQHPLSQSSSTSEPINPIPMPTEQTTEQPATVHL